MLPPPVFIVSTGRSGSKMLARVLGCPPRVLALHEPRPHLKTEAYLKWKGIRDRNYVHYRIKSARELIDQTIKFNNLLYVESSHFMSHFIHELYSIYNAKFIHLFRNPFDFARSALRKGWYSASEQSLKARATSLLRRHMHMRVGNSWIDHRLSPPNRLTERYEKAAWLWSELNGVILRDLKEIPSENQFSLRLEDFNHDVVCNLLEFVGVPVDDPCVENMMAIAAKKPNQSRDPENAAVDDEWTVEHKQQIHNITGAEMAALGYICD